MSQRYPAIRTKEQSVSKLRPIRFVELDGGVARRAFMEDSGSSALERSWAERFSIDCGPAVQPILWLVAGPTKVEEKG